MSAPGPKEVEEEGGKDVMAPPPFHQKFPEGRSQLPLLHDDGRGRPSYDASPDRRRPAFRRSHLHSRSPDTAARMVTKKKYTYAAFFLILSLITFTIQTETAVYVQHTLKWNKAYCML